MWRQRPVITIVEGTQLACSLSGVTSKQSEWSRLEHLAKASSELLLWGGVWYFVVLRYNKHCYPLESLWMLHRRGRQLAHWLCCAPINGSHVRFLPLTGQHWSLSWTAVSSFAVCALHLITILVPCPFGTCLCVSDVKSLIHPSHSKCTNRKNIERKVKKLRDAKKLVN